MSFNRNIEVNGVCAKSAFVVFLGTQKPPQAAGSKPIAGQSPSSTSEVCN